MISDRLILDSIRLPATIRVGDHVNLKITGHVRRIEAEEIDVTGYSGSDGIAVLHGQVEVELTIEEIAPA